MHISILHTQHSIIITGKLRGETTTAVKTKRIKAVVVVSSKNTMTFYL